MVYELSPAAGRLLAWVDGTRTIEELAQQAGLAPDQCAAIMDGVFVPRGLVGFGTAPAPRMPGSRLWARLQLLSPAGVESLGQAGTWLFRPHLAWPLLALGVAATLWLVVTGRTVERLHPGASWGWLLGLLLVYATFLFHEMGHAAALVSRGRRPGTIGVGMYRVLPVFFTDVSEAAHLRARDRVVVNLGGLYFQTLTCLPLALGYALTSHPAFIQAGWGVATAVAFNLNPLLRLDGYWVWEDLSGERNLDRNARQRLFRLWQRPGNAVRASRALRVYTAVVVVYLVGLTAWFLFGVAPQVLPRLVAWIRGLS